MDRIEYRGRPVYPTRFTRLNPDKFNKLKQVFEAGHHEYMDPVELIPDDFDDSGNLLYDGHHRLILASLYGVGIRFTLHRADRMVREGVFANQELMEFLRDCRSRGIERGITTFADLFKVSRPNLDLSGIPSRYLEAP